MTLNLMFCNIRGLENKPLLRMEVSALKPDILCFAETFLLPGKQPRIPGYYGFHQYRGGRNVRQQRGGTSIYVRNYLQATQINHPAHITQQHEFITVKVFFANRELLITSLYNPPDGDAPLVLLEYLFQLGPSIIASDLNARHELLNDVRHNRRGQQLLAWIETAPVTTLHIEEPTYHQDTGNGSSNPDYILISDTLSNCLPFTQVQNDVGSDHLPILATFPFHPPPGDLPPRHQFHNFNKTDWTLFTRLTKEYAETNPPATITTPQQIEDTSTTLTNILTDIISQTTPLQTKRGFAPSYPQEIVDLIKERRQVRRAMARQPELRPRYYQLGRQLQAQTRPLFAQAWARATKDLDHLDGGLFWKKFRGMTGKREESRPFHVDGEWYATDADKAGVLARLQESICTTPDKEHFCPRQPAKVARFMNENQALLQPAIIPNPYPPNPPPHLQEITVPDLQCVLGQQKNTAPGPDGIPWTALKKCPPQFLALYANLFTAIVRSGHFPREWKKAHITYIPKPGKPQSNPLNLRPISLLSTQGKLFEKAYIGRLRRASDQKGAVPPNQYGFRGGLSCHNALVDLTSCVTDSLNKRDNQIALFLDMEKAYDKVWHDGLVFKMNRAEFPPEMLRLVNSWLTDRTAAARHGQSLSEYFPLAGGVPQGAPWSCDLYNIWIGDCPKPPPAPPTARTAVVTRFFADDTSHVSRAKTVRAAHRNLQTYIAGRYEKWLNKWRIPVNVGKSVVVHFVHSNYTRTHADPIHLTLHGQEIPVEKSTKYLGLVFNRHLNWSQHLQSVRGRVIQRTNLLRMLRAKGLGTNQHTLLHCYKTFIRPVIEYGHPAIVTSSTRYQRSLVTMERNCLRRSLGMDPQYPSSFLLEDLDLEPIRDRLHTLRANFLARQLTHEHRRIHDIYLRGPTLNTRKPKRKYRQPSFVLARSLRYAPEKYHELLDAQLIPPPVLEIIHGERELQAPFLPGWLYYRERAPLPQPPQPQ